MIRFLEPDRCPLCDVDVDDLDRELQDHIVDECPGAEELALGDRLLVAFNYGRQTPLS